MYRKIIKFILLFTFMAFTHTVTAGTIINGSTVLTQSVLDSYSWPVTINGGTSISPVVITLGEDVILSNAQNYFILNGDYINFNGINHKFIISGIGFYKGLIKNGSYDSSWVEDPNNPDDYIQQITIVDGFSNINIFNVTVNATGSDLASGSGWIGQDAFSINATNGIFENCSSNGPIRQGSGGIVGQRTSVTVKNSSFYGNHIGGYAGGIFGERSSGTAINCFSIAPSLGNRGGGIFGGNALNATAINCYSTSTIVGNSGGIFGGFSSNCNASNSYSTGTIGSNAGGVYGGNSSGGSATNCYSANGNWNDSTANSILQGVSEGIWNDPDINSSTVNYNLIFSPTILITTLASDNSEIIVTLSESSYNTISGSGALEVTDFSLSISGGTATLSSNTPSSISTVDKTSFTLGISLTGTMNGLEVLTVSPVANSIYSSDGNLVSVLQSNNSVQINDLTPLVITGPSSATGANSSISIKENTQAVYAFVASKIVTWSLGSSSDEDLFSIDSSGDLAFKSNPDFETPLSTNSNNVYLVEVIATDALKNIASQTVTITLTDVISATFSAFESVSKTYFDVSYIIAPPTSSNSNPLIFKSSNLSVATISGTTVTITGVGATTITASQAFDSNFDTNSITSILTVSNISVTTKNGQISLTSSDYIDKNGKIGGDYSLTNSGRSVATKSRDGLSSSTAGTSAKQIKKDFSKSLDGIYWISNSNINGGIPFQIYADMTTDGGGWMLLNVGAGSTAAIEVSSVTSLVDLKYLNRATVIELAKLCTDVQLRAGDSSTSYANKTTSTSPLAIGALQSAANDVNGAATWANGASSTFVVNSGSWLWAYCCPGSAAGWPKMYHSNNYTNGVHWFADLGVGRKNSSPRDAWFSTWIR